MEQFDGVIVKSGGAGQVVYLRDIARVELGAQTYDSFNSRSGFDASHGPSSPDSFRRAALSGAVARTKRRDTGVRDRPIRVGRTFLYVQF